MGKRKISCLPCRLKKVKCTGEIPCERCRKKKIMDCILPPPGAVGRPPKNCVVKRVNATISLDQTCREFIFEHYAKTSSHIMASPMPPLTSPNWIMEYFFSNHCNRLTQLLNHFRQQYSLNHNQLKKKGQISNANSIQDLIHFFSYKSSGLVDHFIQKVSKIRAIYYTEPKFVVIGLALDDTNSFFDLFSPVSVDPLKSLPTEQGLELIEYFFCLNPQSIIINKTMLIESYWADTLDPLLLSVIYGTAIYTSSLLKNEPLKRWGASNKSERNLFLNYAHTLLQTQEQQPSFDTSPKEALSRFQAIVLLATFEALFGYPKKGVSLLGFAYMMATDLGVFSGDEGPTSSASKIDKELLRMTFWSAYQGTIRGCIELEEIPREILANHSLPLPPVNLYSSVSLRFDLMSGHTRLLKIDNYLVETFYIESVIARLTCRFLHILPYSKGNEAYKKQGFKPTFLLTSLSQKDEITPLGFNYPCKDIRLGLQNILDEYKQFIDASKNTWSQLQEFNFELIYLLYSFALIFLKDEYRSESSFRSYTEGGPILKEKESDYKIKVQAGLKICRSIVEVSLDFLEKTSNYCDDPTFVPKRLLMCCLDISSQLFIYSIKTDPIDTTSRYQLNHILSILWRNDIWIDWPPVRAATRTIESFLKAKMPREQDNHDLFDSSPSNSFLDFLFFDGIC
ncbi:hypothetical protein K501DRAFT_333568 [Backusella circina FSU 941]|nr:hypothetical protein K501DRAFT_333568 [Backusella circina FSU 941]